MCDLSWEIGSNYTSRTGVSYPAIIDSRVERRKEGGGGLRCVLGGTSTAFFFTRGGFRFNHYTKRRIKIWFLTQIFDNISDLENFTKQTLVDDETSRKTQTHKLRRAQFYILLLKLLKLFRSERKRWLPLNCCCMRVCVCWLRAQRHRQPWR